MLQFRVRIRVRVRGSVLGLVLYFSVSLLTGKQIVAENKTSYSIASDIGSNAPRSLHPVGPTTPQFFDLGWPMYVPVFKLLNRR